MPYATDLGSLCLVVPTYNEAQNVAQLVTGVRAATSRLERPMDILFVDDSSPDGTASVVRAIQRIDPHVHLLVRETKEGLGMAYRAGMRHAIDALGAGVVFEMDADLSHDPIYLLDMIRELRDVDVVIGSCWMEGGGVDDDWPWQRVVASRVANDFIRMMLGIRNVYDVTGGFRAIRFSSSSGNGQTEICPKASGAEMYWQGGPSGVQMCVGSTCVSRAQGFGRIL